MFPIILSRVEQHTKSKIIEDDEDEEDQETVKIESDGKLIEAEKIRKGKVSIKKNPDHNTKKYILYIHIQIQGPCIDIVYLLEKLLTRSIRPLLHFSLANECFECFVELLAQ